MNSVIKYVIKSFWDFINYYAFFISFYSSLERKKEMKTVNITTLPNNCRPN